MTLFQEIKKINGTPKQIRDFGFVMSLFFGILGLIAYFHGKPSVFLWISLAAFFLIAAFIAKPLLQILYKPWMVLALVMGAMMSRVILVVLFAVAICPIALFLRLSGRDILNVRWRKSEAESYWLPHKSPADKKQYESQF